MEVSTTYLSIEKENTLLMNKVPQEPEESFQNCSYPCPKIYCRLSPFVHSEPQGDRYFRKCNACWYCANIYMNFTPANHVFAKSFLRYVKQNNIIIIPLFHVKKNNGNRPEQLDAV